MSAANRICLVAPEFIGPYPNGGVGTACYWEAMSLGAAGFDLTVLYTGPTERFSAAHWQSHFAATAPFAYVDLAEWASHTGADRDAGVWTPAFPEARTSELVLKYLREHRFDLVLAQEFQGHALRSLQARESGDALTGVRIAITLHGSRQWTCEGMQRLPVASDMAVDFLEKESTRLADAVIAPSRSMASWVTSRWRLDQPSVIPYCFDNAAATSRRVVTHEGPFSHLVFFGRLETRKGVHLLLRALAERPALRGVVERVTFLGKHARIEGVPSEQFIQAEAAKLLPIDVEVIADKGSHEAVRWLRAQQGALALAPSLGDNLPYTLIEMHTHRIPFVSTRVGGIPEIVGPANAHLLAEPTASGLADVLERICLAGRVTIDYRDGYDVGTATNTHVSCVQSLLASSAPQPKGITRRPLRVVVTDAMNAEAIEDTRHRWSGTEAKGAEWVTLAEWRHATSDLDTLFVHSSVRPANDLVERLRTALTVEGNDAATCFYVSANSHDGSEESVVAPLGAAVDVGWSRNVFGGPCVLVRHSAVARLRESETPRFEFWPAYAALVTSGAHLAIVPAPLYTCDVPGSDTCIEQIEAVVREYHRRRPGALDLRWLLKGAYAAAGGGSSIASAAGVHAAATEHAGRAMYDRLHAISDAELQGFAELDTALVQSDPFFRDFANVRARLSPILQRFAHTEPRVYIYGAGQHTRMLLAAFPALGRCVDGFIDRQGGRTFLGKPCITPDDFRNYMADVVIYSSREWERDMHRQLQHASVEHVLLYTEGVGAPAPDTATRLARRFDIGAVDQSPLTTLLSRRPAWLKGAISGGDCLFLHHIVQGLAPQHALELGVASGCSSATLLCALDNLPDSGHPRTLSSFDVLDRCYFDAQYATGEAARIMYSQPRTTWALNTSAMDARAIARSHGPHMFDFAFIDANHCHPWPLLDVLHLTRVIKPGSWIVLHDIELPNVHPQCPDRGALLLFQHWPFAKVHGFGDSRNIGAVQLPMRPADLLPTALALMNYEWQWPVHEAFMELPPEFEGVARVLRTQLEAHNANRPVRRLAAV